MTVLLTVPVLGYEGIYSVSSDGRIWSMRTKRELKPYASQRISLSRNGEVTDSSVDLLVLSAFGRTVPDGLVIKHLDGNKANHAITNLDFDLHRCKRGHAFVEDNIYTNPSRPDVKHCKACRDWHHSRRVSQRRIARAAAKDAADE